MANNLQILRALALCQCATGFLMIIFGIVDRTVVHFWTSHVGFPIWTGAWITGTGVIGFFASSRQRSAVNIPLVGVCLGFSITASVLAGIILVCYSIVLATKSSEWRTRGYRSYEGYPTTSHDPDMVIYRYDLVDFYDGGTYLYGASGYNTSMTISVIVLILGLVDFFVGIWSAVCCCQAFGCECCAIEQQVQAGQVMYVTNQAIPVSTQVLTQNTGGLGVHSGPISAAPSSGGTMMAVPVQVSSSGQTVMAVHMPHVGSPMMAIQVHAPISTAPVVALPAQTVSHVAVPVGVTQLQGQRVVDASLTMGQPQHVNV